MNQVPRGTWERCSCDGQRGPPGRCCVRPPAGGQSRYPAARYPLLLAMPVPRGQPRHVERTRLYYSLDKVGSGHPWDPGRPGTHAGGSARRRGLNGLNRRLFPWSSLSSTQSDHDSGHSDVVFGEHLFFNTEAMSLSFKEKGREKGRKERRERGRKQLQELEESRQTQNGGNLALLPRA